MTRAAWQPGASGGGHGGACGQASGRPRGAGAAGTGRLLPLLGGPPTGALSSAVCLLAHDVLFTVHLPG